MNGEHERVIKFLDLLYIERNRLMESHNATVINNSEDNILERARVHGATAQLRKLEDEFRRIFVSR